MGSACSSGTPQPVFARETPKKLSISTDKLDLDNTNQGNNGGHSGHSNRDRSRNNAHVSKPFNMTDLLTTLHEQADGETFDNVGE